MFHLLAATGDPVHRFGDRIAVQLNDTHASIAVAELMRLLVDEHQLGWEEAWRITVRSFGYTNHTLLPEALETWPLRMFEEFLPRHLEIIYEINARFLAEVRVRFPGDGARVARMSLIGETGQRSVRMANLATVGSHAVNGVAAMHTELLKSSVLRDFHELRQQREAGAGREHDLPVALPRIAPPRPRRYTESPRRWHSSRNRPRGLMMPTQVPDGTV